MLIAIAKSRGLNVVGIVRRSELVPQIEKLGVDFVGVESLELPKQIQSATGGMPISLGLDAIGGPATATMAGVLSSGAHLVSYAWLSGLPIQVPQGDLIIKRLNIHGFWMYYDEYLPKIQAALTEAAKVVASGKLTLPITATYKPSQIKEAVEDAQRGGKVLLDFNHPKWACRDQGMENDTRHRALRHLEKHHTSDALSTFVHTFDRFRCMCSKGSRAVCLISE
jgi:mitochondrial enoyl-[acyl-carrier protein] reductase / trans-2-enoyl-CoA reductase